MIDHLYRTKGGGAPRYEIIKEKEQASSEKKKLNLGGKKETKEFEAIDAILKVGFERNAEGRSTQKAGHWWRNGKEKGWGHRELKAIAENFGFFNLVERRGISL